MSKDVKRCENMKNTESLKMAQLFFIPAETTTTDSLKLKGIKKKKSILVSSTWHNKHLCETQEQHYCLAAAQIGFRKIVTEQFIFLMDLRRLICSAVTLSMSPNTPASNN